MEEEKEIICSTCEEMMYEIRKGRTSIYVTPEFYTFLEANIPLVRDNESLKGVSFFGITIIKKDVDNHTEK